MRKGSLAGTGTARAATLTVSWTVLLCLLCTVVILLPEKGHALSRAAARLSSADRSFNLLKSRKSRQKYRHHYENVEKLYRQVIDNHPGSDESQRALLNCGELYTLLYRWTSGKADLKRSSDYYRRLLREYPDGTLADDALVALAFMELNYYNDPPAAYRLFAETVKSYPRGDRAGEAERWLRKLRRYAPRAETAEAPARKRGVSGGASSLLKDAERRFDSLSKKRSLQRYRHNYENVLARLRKVFEEHPGSPEAPQALFRSGELYTLLYRWTQLRGDLDSARQYYQRVIQDYPGSSYSDDAQLAIGYLYRDHYRNKSRAYEEFEKVTLLYPGSDSKKEAERELQKLAAHRPRRETAVSVSQGSASTARVTGIRHWSNPSYTRVVIDLDRSTNFYSHFLKESAAQGKPPRLYVDLFKSRLDPNHPGSIPVNDGILLSIRAGQYKSDTVRVVLDIDQLKSHQIFAMENPFRIVIDASGGGEAPRRPVASPGTVAEPAVSEPYSVARQLMLGVSRVVIDPGHGARDPGAVGVHGIKEKDIVLDIALRLRTILQRAGLEVILTRDRDMYLGLEERTAIANSSNGDLFISIHANSSKNSNLKGIETYYLDFAKSRRAMETAALENSMALAKMSDLEGILREIVITTKKYESGQLAEVVQKNLVRSLRKHFSQVKDLGVKKGPFYVLIGARMPSVLAEVSFINHPVEGKRLATENYRQRLAEALADGVRNYIRTVKPTVSSRN